MTKQLLFVLFLNLFNSCISPFDFEVDTPSQALVVEGFVSDISFNEMSNEPVDARYFAIRLSWISLVDNIRDQSVEGAEVTIKSETGESWDYSESESGIYTLYFEDFQAVSGNSYQVEITLTDGKQFASDWQSVPENAIHGNLTWKETSREVYSTELGEEVIISADGLAIVLQMPSGLKPSSTVYKKWDFTTTYGFVARLNPTVLDPNYKCWITEELFYPGFELADFNQANTEHELLFVSTATEKIHEGLSILFRQQTMNQGYYTYWDDIKRQEDQEGLFAPPPYNLSTNITAVNSNEKVYGYFGVVREDFYRWIFQSDMVSYDIVYPESLKNSCNIPMPPESCYDCTQASLVTRSTVTNTKPRWWKD